MDQQKFITSHKFRVQRANKRRELSPEKISLFDREAYVEGYLLEDVVHLYEFRLKKEMEKTVETRAGIKARSLNIERFTAIVNIFKAAIELVEAQIAAGNYSVVWKNIPERALMKAANSVKYLPELKIIAINLLKGLSDETLLAVSENVQFDEALDDLESHESNVRRVRDLPSVDEVNAIIEEVERVIPNNKPNLN